MKYINHLAFLILLMNSTNSIGEETQNTPGATGGNPTPAEVAKAKEKAINDADNELTKLGFGPALFFVKYDQEILKDSKDVITRGDGTISSNGSKYSASLGLELHYDFSFWRKQKCYINCSDPKNWNITSSHRLSPYIGIFDIENGMNGLSAGLIYGYTKGDKDNKNKTTLNFGLGWMVHKDRVVLARGVSEGSPPPASLNESDYTERKDIKDLNLMISVNIGF